MYKHKDWHREREVTQRSAEKMDNQVERLVVLTEEARLYIPRDSRWTAGQRWQCPRCQRSQQQSVKYSRERWQWSRPPAAPRPGSIAHGLAGRWRWQSDRWTLVLKRHTHPGCGLWCAEDSKRSGSGRPWPSTLDTPEQGGTERGEVWELQGQARKQTKSR